MSDPVQSWLNNAGRYPLLPKSEQMRLAKLRETYKPGSKQYIKIVNKLTNHNLRLVPNVVRAYLAKRAGYTMNSEVASDLLQQGYLGLRRAAEKYDGKRGFTFATYAQSWIYQSVVRWHNSCDRLIYVPENSITEVLYRRRHGKPSNSKNGRIGDACIASAVRTLDISSLDRLGGDDEDTCLLDIMSDDHRIIDNKNTVETSDQAELALKDLMSACGIRPVTQDIITMYTKRPRMSIVACKVKMSTKHCQNLYGAAVRVMKTHVEESSQSYAGIMNNNQPH